MGRPRPDFVIIGAQKSGSTALMRLLGDHPQVYLPEQETQYFRDPWFAMQDPSVLADAVAAAGPGVVRRGIKCPDYLPSPSAPQRILDELGEVDLLAVLRDPVARAVSAYFWGVQWGWVPRLPPAVGLTRLLDGVVDPAFPRAGEVLEYGDYAEHLERWLSLWPREKLTVLVDEDLRPDRVAATMGRVFAVLGVDDDVPVVAPDRRVNTGVYAPLRLRVLGYRTPHILREFPGHPGKPYLQPARGVRGRVVNRSVSLLDRLVLARLVDNSRPEIPPAVLDRLAERYRPGVEKLERLLDRDLPTWHRPARSTAPGGNPMTTTPSSAPATTPPTGGGRRAAARRAYYPETAIDGYSRVDSAVEFYLRVDALLDETMTVVDFGAGRGQWYFDPTSATRTRLRNFRGRAAHVIGLDVDPVVSTNPSLDDARVITPADPLPLDDASVDLVVSDFTFEHVDDPHHVARELARVVRPGGWVCARTPNKHGYIGLGARAVPNQWHVSWLKALQPGRKAEDVFPVRYQLNTPADLKAAFDESRWEHVVYAVDGEPGYAGGSPLAWAVGGAFLRLQPRRMRPMLLIFLRRK